MYVCMYACMYSCMYVCMYMHVYCTHTRTHTHRRTHTHTHTRNQVYLLASLTSALQKYHNTLPVLLTDDLLSLVRHLLHNSQSYTKQQRLLGLVKLLGELYNDLVIDSPIIFDALYTFISGGNERVGILPDPPADFTRVRLVCTLLDTCGHYFDRGVTKKKLEVFLAHFQRYLRSE